MSKARNNYQEGSKQSSQAQLATPAYSAASHSATQEFANILQNPKVHWNVHKGPPLVPIFCQMKLVHTNAFLFL
jgi:hypothetical protein